MATPTLPPVVSLPSISKERQIEVLDILFEPSPAIHALVLPLLDDVYASYTDLISVVRPKLLGLCVTDKPTVYTILGAHPRLGEKKPMSAHSTAEQANLQSNSDKKVEEVLAQMNAAYEQKFPFRFVTFVNGRGRGEIIDEIKYRIERGDVDAEEKAGIEAMCDIAVDRAVKLLLEERGEA